MDYTLLAYLSGLLLSIAVIGVILYLLKVYYFNGGVCLSTRRLDGLTVVVTGASDGIGKEAAINLAARGAKIIIAVRDLRKGTNAARDIIGFSSNHNVFVMRLDLSSFKSITEFANEYKARETRLDILINNAGTGLQSWNLSADNNELIFQTNYLGPFLLTMLLLDKLKQSTPSRIINVSSAAHMFARSIPYADINNQDKFEMNSRYCQSKLAQIIFTRKLANILRDTGITVYAVHPGYIPTKIYDQIPMFSIFYVYKLAQRSLMRYIGKNTKQGAQTTIYCAVEEDIERYSGGYFADCKYVEWKHPTRNDSDIDKLWQLSLQMVAPYFKIENM